jgi:PAS domain S-box-containing protein
MEQQMNASQVESTLLRTLIDSLPDVIYVKDDQGRKIIANHADVASLGLVNEGDVIGKTDLELLQGSVGERCYRDDMEIISSGQGIVDKEEFFFDADGRQQWLLTTKIPVQNAAGKTSHLLGIGHNITRRKEYEASLKSLNAELSSQTEELKALNEQLTRQKEQETEKAIAQGKFEIASEILHDIGNALVGFGAYLNRINRVLEKGNLKAVQNLSLFINTQQTTLSSALGPDKAAALLALTEGIAKTQTENNTELSTSVNELLNITTHIQEILNIQRQFVGSHEGHHQRKPVNLVNIINDCRSMLLATLEKKRIKLHTHIAPGTYVVKGDHTKLMQVILNALKNSVEAIDMEAHEKNINISLQASTGFIELKVKDNGNGFSPETRERLFQRGFTTKSNGTGLGLYNCRSIIESHAGEFDIQSDGADKGAEITIRFNRETTE